MTGKVPWSHVTQEKALNLHRAGFPLGKNCSLCTQPELGHHAIKEVLLLDRNKILVQLGIQYSELIKEGQPPLQPARKGSSSVFQQRELCRMIGEMC